MMDSSLYNTTTPAPMTRAERAKRAGMLLCACIELDEDFIGQLSGWRVIVGRVRSHREMVEDDIFQPEEVF